MNEAEAINAVITDASVLINLTHTKHLPLLGTTPGYRFLVSDEVLAEVRDPVQKGMVDGAILDGLLEKTSIETPEELAAYVDLARVLGSGESACLALASSRGWFVACDERRVFLREA